MNKSVLCFHRIIKISLLFVIIAITSYLIECKSTAKVPDYIARCNKNDSQLNECILRAIESLRPRFDKGIPELGVPPLDPLILPEIVVFRGEKGGIKAIANDIKITGMKDFKFLSLSVNLNTLEFKSTVFFPSLHFEGTYDVNAKFSDFRVKGKGPFRGNASEITVDGFVKGKLVTNQDIRYLEFEYAQAHVSFKEYQIRVEKLFKDEQLNDAFNQFINDRNVVPIEAVKMMINNFISKMWVDTWNKMSKSISFDELFL